jgi:hypothetical protein
VGGKGIVYNNAAVLFYGGAVIIISIRHVDNAEGVGAFHGGLRE